MIVSYRGKISVDLAPLEVYLDLPKECSIIPLNVFFGNKTSGKIGTARNLEFLAEDEDWVIGDITIQDHYRHHTLGLYLYQNGSQPQIVAFASR